MVTHNSELFISNLVESLAAQTHPIDRLKIIDSGSVNVSYLNALLGHEWPFRMTVSRFDNIGFCRANNIALAEGASDFWLLINPDATISSEWLDKAIRFLTLPSEARTGIVSSPLERFDISTNIPTGRYDSCGIYRSWYGRWYDKAQGVPLAANPLDASPIEPTAICGALMLVRDQVVQHLRQVDGEFFDESFFMYKDDIDVSLRVRKLGWRIKLLPELKAYHCRGWQKNRAATHAWQRHYSAINEVKLAWKNRSPYLVVYLLKSLYVRYLEHRVMSKNA